MAKGSQLAQLKTALSSAGLSRKSQPGASGKKRKRAAAAGRDPALEKAQKAKKLDEINQRLNPFDVKVTKMKHDVGGRKVKGVVGRPAASKQEGLDKRKKVLLSEYERKNRAGGIVDRRFGEDDPTLTAEERMLERFTRERQRASRGVNFNLDDEDAELTHYGQSLSAVDDFDSAGLTLADDDEDVPFGPDVANAPRRTADGDDEDDDPDEPPRKKSKAEVMAEVMAKSKEHKALRQLAKEADEEVRHAMDADFGSIRDLLFGQKIDPSSSGSNAVPLGVRPSAPSADPDAVPSDSAPPPPTDAPQIDDYDQVVRQLAFDKRAKPTDRTKTEEELAVEEAEKLQKQERARLRRMRGEDGDSEDEDADSRPRKRRKGVAQGDDLEDDFDLSEEEERVIGPGLEEALSSSEGEGDEEGDSEGEGNGSDEESGSESAPGSGSEVDDSGSDVVLVERSPASKGKGKATSRKRGELPFTFPAPSSHEEFLDIIDDIDASDVPTVVQRIRTIYHSSLGEDNKFKLQKLCSVLIEHVLYVAAPPSSLAPAEALSPHIYALTKQYPIPSATAFTQKVQLMQKNFVRGLEKGPLSPTSRTFPGTSELALLRTIGNVWSTSDLKHVVASSAALLMAQYLGQGRVRSLSDLASGLFLCNIVHYYHRLSKRFMPEVTNFLFQALVILAPHALERKDLPGPFPVLDFAKHTGFAIKTKSANKLTVRPAPLTEIINNDHSTPPSEQHKLDLLVVTYGLIGEFANLHKELDGFIELFEPFSKVLQAVKIRKLPADVQKLHGSKLDAIQRMLKFAEAERKPLMAQSHKPIPIATYAPKFDERYSYQKRHDPDVERNAASKLRAEYKKEHKGAMRELRKDSRFLAEEQTRRQLETDAGYKSRMAKVHGSIEVERAEEKVMEREKAKEKRRAGKK